MFDSHDANKTRLLIVDDDSRMIGLARRYFVEREFDVKCTDRLTEAFSLIVQDPVKDVVLLDVVMGPKDARIFARSMMDGGSGDVRTLIHLGGFRFLKAIREVYPGIPVVVWTSHEEVKHSKIPECLGFQVILKKIPSLLPSEKNTNYFKQIAGLMQEITTPTCALFFEDRKIKDEIEHELTNLNDYIDLQFFISNMNLSLTPLSNIDDRPVTALALEVEAMEVRQKCPHCSIIGIGNLRNRGMILQKELALAYIWGPSEKEQGVRKIESASMQKSYVMHQILALLLHYHGGLTFHSEEEPCIMGLASMQIPEEIVHIEDQEKMLCSSCELALSQLNPNRVARLRPKHIKILEKWWSRTKQIVLEDTNQYLR